MGEQIHPFRNGLKHAEFDAVVYEFDKMPSSGAARVDIAAVDGKFAQDRLDLRNRFGLATDHKAGARERPARPARRPRINEMQMLLPHARMAPDGIAPV